MHRSIAPPTAAIAFIAFSCSASAVIPEQPDVIRVEIPVQTNLLLPRALSADGRVVGGDYLDSNGRGRAFVWYRDGRVFLLENNNGGIFIKGLSPDGKVAVGNRWVGRSSIAFRWTPESGIVDLPTPAANALVFALGTNQDASVIAGKYSINGGNRAWVWTPENGLVPLPAAPGSTGGTAYAVSPDGSMIVGCSYGGPATLVPTMWTRRTVPPAQPSWSPAAIDALGLELSQNPVSCVALSMSSDGSIIVGQSGSENGAAIWNRNGQGRFLGGTTNIPRMDTALAVTADGRQIAGRYLDPTANPDGDALWSELSGPVLIRPLLWSLGLPSVPGDFIAMSADGRSLLFGGSGATSWLVVGVPRIDAPRCPPDFDANRLVDDRDFVVFAAAYSIGDCAATAMPATCPADFDGDRFVTDADFAVFAARYSDVLCPR